MLQLTQDQPVTIDDGLGGLPQVHTECVCVFRKPVTLNAGYTLLQMATEPVYFVQYCIGLIGSENAYKPVWSHIGRVCVCTTQTGESSWNHEWGFLPTLLSHTPGLGGAIAQLHKAETIDCPNSTN